MTNSATTKPYFSIIIPTLNEQKYVPLLLSDLAAQSFREYEIIVVDGYSTDKTIEKIQTFQDKIHQLQILYSKTRHVCFQRNMGARQAKGEWLVFMDADDRLPSFFLLGLKYRLETDPADLASCWIEADRRKPAEKTIATVVNYTLELSKNTKYFIFPESMTIAKKELFLAYGGFDESINYAESRQLISSFLAHGKTIALYKDPTYQFSLRRLRKYGIVELASRMAKAHLSTLTNKNLSTREIQSLYPMRGGAFFDQPLRKKKNFIRNIAKLFEMKD